MNVFASYPQDAKEEIYKYKQLKYYVYELFYLRQKKKEIVKKINNSIVSRRTIGDDNQHWAVEIDEDSPQIQAIMCIDCGNYRMSYYASSSICCKCPDDYDYEYEYY